MSRTALAALALALCPLSAAAATLCTGTIECRNTGACNQDDPIPLFQLERQGSGLTLAWNRPSEKLKDQLQSLIDKRTGKTGPSTDTGWNGPGRTLSLSPIGPRSFAGSEGAGGSTLLLTLSRSGAFVLTSHRAGQRPTGNSITGICEGQP
ncbi:hypothetical protein FHY55_10865 [Oceanicola sp. D3]|uniref:hypothetical protein n=1 Tax=Oceanicola sp. D3 TaxID=2587163 RepID=UPI00111DAFEA|nr:hypothetical protein [Oceanicola sp. D3]QDC09715.1 hypothetical protein FHY55_10865 [Oceanicola sp. D3]